MFECEEMVSHGDEVVGDRTQRGPGGVVAAIDDGPAASHEVVEQCRCDGHASHVVSVEPDWVSAASRSVQTVVVDPAGEWMRSWRDGFEQQAIEVLRSPGVHHPDPDDMAYVHAHPQRDSFDGSCAATPSSGVVGPLRRPTTKAFWRFCKTLIARTGLDGRVVEASVTELRPMGNDSSSKYWEVHLDTGAVLHARQVLWAGNPRRCRVPHGVELGGGVEHSSSVDLSRVRAGERIAVLGGGQTAGQLALRAAQRGAAVSLISRGPRRIASLDVDAGWLMGDHLDPFRAIADPGERRLVVERVQCGSMTADLDIELQRARVTRFADAGDITARPHGAGAVAGFAGIECMVDRVWSATGSVPDLRSAPALAALADRGAPHVNGWPVLDGALRWGDGLFVAGALAALTLGPAAGNLGGARAAADLLAGVVPISAAVNLEPFGHPG